MTARPLKPSWCGLCWSTHNLADRCDPVERAAVVDARNDSLSAALAEAVAGHRARVSFPSRARTDDEDLDAAYRDEGAELTANGWR